MRVLFISHEATRTGAPVALLQELRIIKEKYSELSFDVLMLDDGELIDDYSKICRVYRGGNKFVLLLNRFLVKLNPHYQLHLYKYLIRRNKYDCIYANTIASLQAGCLLKKKLGIPLVLHVHEAKCLIRFYDISPSLFSLVDSFIAVSHIVSDNLIKNYNISEDKIKIQPPISCWLEKFQRKEFELSPFAFDDDVVLIGCFINNGWFKGGDMLPILINRVFSKSPKLKCKFALVGPLNEEILWNLKYELRKIGYDDKVVWLDKVKDPLNYHARFDLLLLMSREESFSLVAQESAIMGNPIVGFHDTVGIEEWIGNSGGRWVSYLDIEAMADCIIYLCENKDIRISLGESAKSIVVDMYNKCLMIGNVISAIKELGNDFLNDHECC